MLRDYQHKLKNDLYRSWWAGNRNVLLVSPTGSGKTVTMQSITGDCQESTWSIAHRRELVGQISLALARVGIYHRIIAPDVIIRMIVDLHVKEFGQSFVHPNSNHFVASVQTINARLEQLKPLIEQCKLWNMDEGHHIRADNLWGRTIAEFKNAYGAGYTALAQRGDRKGLGRHCGGVFDDLVIGPPVRLLMDQGHLVDYIVYAPQISSIDVSNIPVTATGEYSQPKLSSEAKRSTITGDTVQSYLRFAPGKIGATFCVDVGIAEETTAGYIAAGVPAALITDKTPDKLRFEIMADVRTGLIKQVSNVDILGEGVDVPVLEVVTLARPTASEQLHRQQMGRVLRPAPERGKSHGIIIDQVKNIETLKCPPDKPGNHSLDAVERKKRNALNDPDEIPTHTCPACHRFFESWQPTCIHCGHLPAPALRDRPELVEGDLLLYTPDLLARLTGEIERLKGPPRLPISAGPAAVAGARVNWSETQTAQVDLSNAIAWWAGVQRHIGRSDREGYIRFYRTFGVDVATAQTLRAGPARLLYDQIWKDIGDDVDSRQLR
jgi:DNA repair protein RadD